MGFVSLYHCKRIVSILVGFSFSISRFLLTLFNLIASPLFRFKATGISLKNDFDSSATEAIELEEESNLEPEPDTEAETNDACESVKDVEEKLEFSFTFKFPTFEEFTSNSSSKKGKCQLFGSDSVYSSDTSWYESTSGQSNPLSVKNPEVVDLDVNEIHGDLGDTEEEGNREDFIKIVYGEEKTESFEPEDFEIEQVLEKEHSFLGNHELPSVRGNFIKVVYDEEKTENSEPVDLTEEIGEVLEKEHKFLDNQEVPSVHGDLIKEGSSIKEVCDEEKTENFEPEDFTEEIGEVLEKEHNFLGNQELPNVYNYLSWSWI